MDALTVSRAESGQKLLNFLQRRIEAAAGELHKWIRSGQVRVNGGRSKAFDRVSEGDLVRVPPFAALKAPGSASPVRPRPAFANAFGGAAILPVIYEDEDILVLNKPSGLPSQGGTRPCGQRGFPPRGAVPSCGVCSRPRAQAGQGYIGTADCRQKLRRAAPTQRRSGRTDGNAAAQGISGPGCGAAGPTPGRANCATAWRKTGRRNAWKQDGRKGRRRGASSGLWKHVTCRGGRQP